MSKANQVSLPVGENARRAVVRSKLTKKVRQMASKKGLCPLEPTIMGCFREFNGNEQNDDTDEENAHFLQIKQYIRRHTKTH